MQYIKKTIKAMSFVWIRKSNNINVPPPDSRREKKGNASPEEVRKNNERYAKRHLEALVDLNFKKGDFWIDLHYGKDDRPMDYANAETRLTKFIRKLRDEWRAAGGVLKYIATTECGKSGGYHHHILLNVGTVSAERVMMIWGMRYASNKLVYSEDLSDLADYIFKQSTLDQRKERGLEGKKRWRASKNLIRPKVEKEIVNASTWAQTPRPPKGYMLDRDSIEQGHDWLGFPWMEYKLIKIPQPKSTSKKRRE